MKTAGSFSRKLNIAGILKSRSLLFHHHRLAKAVRLSFIGICGLCLITPNKCAQVCSKLVQKAKRATKSIPHFKHQSPSK